MKAINKYFMVALAALAFVSCAKESSYTPGKAAGSQDYYFSDYDAVQVLDLTATSIDIYVERKDASAAATLPLSSWCSKAGIATFPQSVSFAAGESKAKVSIALGDMEPFEEYQLKVSLPEEYTQPYKTTDGYPTCGFVFYKEDFKPYAIGTLYDDFLYEDYLEDMVLEYSVLLDRYRIKNWLGFGTNFAFGWDGAQKFTSVTAKQPTGYVHPTYGMIAGTLVPAKCKFDTAKNAIHLMITWTFSAGSFGSYENIFFIDKLAN